MKAKEIIATEARGGQVLHPAKHRAHGRKLQGVSLGDRLGGVDFGSGDDVDGGVDFGAGGGVDFGAGDDLEKGGALPGGVEIGKGDSSFERNADGSIALPGDDLASRIQ